MNIGVFTDSYKPYLSGVVRSIDTFAREFEAMGHQVYIFAPAYPHYAQRTGNIFRFRSIRSPTHPGFSLAIPISPRLLATAKVLALDVVHVHSPFLLGRLGARLAHRLQVPLVFTYHTRYDQYVHYVPLAAEPSRRAVLAWVTTFAKQCDTVVVPSQRMRQELRQQGIPTRIEVIPTGIDPLRFQHGDPRYLREHLGLGPDALILLYSGRLGREKNVDFLFYAMQHVVRARSNSYLILAGAGPDRIRLEREAAKLGLARHVRFLGAVTEKVLVDCYAGADVFVFASTSETQGLVVLEAMASGLPVVAVHGPGVEDTIVDGHSGLLVPPSPRTFAAEVLQLASNPSRRAAMGACAKERASLFSARVMAEKLLHLYESLVYDQHRKREVRT